jgi:N-acetylglucosamine-6-sulfatase
MVPDGVQGASWRPIIDDAEAPWRDAVFMEYNGDQGRNAWPMRSVVADIDDRQWKYTWTKGDVDELYDLGADPTETHSLVGSTEHQALRRQLRGRLAKWMRETNDFVEMEEL